MLKAFITVSGLTLVSRVLGFVRDIMLASVLGASSQMEVFVVAFKLPNFFRRLFAEGAFSVAFVPLFSRHLTEKGEGDAMRFAGNVLMVMTGFMLLLTMAFEMWMEHVVGLIAPGFVDQPEKYQLAVDLCRITFPYLGLIVLVNVLVGVLNGKEKFAAGALAPVWLNVAFIGALLYTGYSERLEAEIISYGVALAGVLQLAWMVFSLYHAGIRLPVSFPRLDADMRALCRKMVPGIIGGGIVQINLWVDVLIATMVPSAVAYLYYADRFSQLPMALVGTAVGTVMLPTLTKQWTKGEYEKARDTQNEALRLTVYFTMPAMVGLLTLAYPIMVAMLQRGAFDATASYASAIAMMVYALGLPAFVLVKILTPSFFAVGDTKTPVYFSLVALVVNVVLNLAFIHYFPLWGLMAHVGIATATIISSWLTVFLPPC